MRTIRGPRDGVLRWQDAGEATDPRAFLQAFTQEGTGFSEWHFPVRLLLEIGGYPQVLPGLGAGRGLLPRAEGFRLPQPFPRTSTRAETLPGLTHLDLLTEREGWTARAILDYPKGLRLP